MLKIEKNTESNLTEIYAAYKAWCDENKENVFSRKIFKNDFEKIALDMNQGIKLETKSNGSVKVKGVSFLIDPENLRM